ncbi:MAG: GAF domain-containing sensor histidine kinase, partial [Anaerolineae bacterium]
FTSQDNDRVELSVLRATTRPLPVPQVFRQDSRFITHFCNIRRPLSQYDLDMLSWFQDLSADERLWLKDLILDLYVPILVADRPVALLGLGPKAGGQPYSDQDLETLMILAGQTGTALENARLMDDLRAVQGDLHRLSGELAETNQQLQRLDQTKADFITIASHELRTPLTQIYGYSDILSKLEADELGDARVVYEFVQGITQGASRLKSVVDAMVDMSLIETGSLRVDPVTLPVGVVVQNAVETMQGGTDRRRVKIRVRDLSKLPYIQADSTRLEQVFLSLLSNAVKFTPDGGEITVSGSLDTSSKTAYVDLMVSDSGIGINPEEQALIFEKFHRSEDLLRHSTDDVGFKGAGPGLGLAIAKGIVEAHEGRIWVESPGRDEENCPGSTFHVRLPVAGPTGGAHPTHS